MFIATGGRKCTFGMPQSKGGAEVRQMAIDTEKTWTTLRKRGVGAALILLSTSVVFGVGNYLTDGIIPYIGGAIKDAWSPPRCTIIFSKAVDLDTPGLVFTPDPARR
jgi:hypothetical protein